MESLAVSYAELLEETGAFLGFGRGEAAGDPAWPDRDERHLRSCVKAGVHQVYFPPLLPGTRTAHAWTFLRPVGRVLLTAAQNWAPLPEDFGGFEGAGYARVTGSDSDAGTAAEVVTPGMILALRTASPSATGRPMRLAEARVKSGGGSPQKSRLEVYPTPDQAYTVALTYYVVPAMLDGSHPWVYGGPEHAQTYLQSCLAAAEQRRDGVRGPQWELFVDRLAASVSLDQRRQGERLGYNGDRGNLPRAVSRNTGVTYDGTQYGEW